MNSGLAFWLVIAIVAAVGEILTTGLFLASIAVAAVITAIVSIFLPVGIIEIAVFAAVSLVGIAVFRPIVVHALGMEASSALTGSLSHPYLVGKRALVTRTVDAERGQIRVGQGEFWSARAFNEDDVIPPGRQVEILVVDGLTALVAPVTRPALSASAPDPDDAGVVGEVTE